MNYAAPIGQGGYQLPDYQRDTNELLNAACYRLIAKHQERTGEGPTGLFFNKILSIVNRELEGSTISLNLPHCWYRWGDEVVRVLMPTKLGWVHEDPPRTTVTWDGDPPKMPSEGEARRTIERIDELVESHAGGRGIDRLVDQVYSYAPFPFQNAYRMLRNKFVNLRGLETPLEGVSYGILAPLLDQAMDLFPFDDFPSMGERAETFHLVMKELLQGDEPGMELSRELSEAFWTAFCLNLRLHPSGHGNVPESALDHWARSLESQMIHYDNSFDSILREGAEVVSHFPSTPPIDDLVTEAEEKRNNDLEFIRSFDSELNDIGKFLDSVRQLRQS